VKILVAKMNLDHGAAIKEPKDMFVEKVFNQDDAPKNGLIDSKLLKGKFLKRGLRKEDHVTVDDLMDEKTSLLANLPDGFRAVGVQVTNDAQAAGFASLPGSKVDIILTLKRDEDKRSFSKFLLADVLVLAADATSVRDPDGKAMPASVVTLALSQVDLMKVELAKRYGPLTLVLRKLGDKTPLPDQESLTGDELLKGSAKDDSNGKKTRPGTGQAEVGPNGEPLGNIPDLNPQTGNPANKKVEPPQPKRYYHVVTIRQGDKVTRHVVEVDARGNPVFDDVPGEQLTPPPGVEGKPQDQPQGNNPQPAKKD